MINSRQRDVVHEFGSRFKSNRDRWINMKLMDFGHDLNMKPTEVDGFGSRFKVGRLVYQILGRRSIWSCIG